MPRLHSGSATNGLKTTKTIPLPIRGAVWQQSPKKFMGIPKLINIQTDFSTGKLKKKSQMLEPTLRNVVDL